MVVRSHHGSESMTFHSTEPVEIRKAPPARSASVRLAENIGRSNAAEVIDGQLSVGDAEANIFDTLREEGLWGIMLGEESAEHLALWAFQATLDDAGVKYEGQ